MIQPRKIDRFNCKLQFFILFTDFIPKHAKRYAELDRVIREAFTAYAEEVRGGSFPGPEQSG